MAEPLAWSPPTGPYNAAVDLVDRHRTVRPDKVAFIDPTRQLTFGELVVETDAFAAALRAHGIRPEQRVVLIMLDTVDFPVAFWGAIKAGAVAVPLNTLLSPDQWQYMLEDSRASAVVVSSELWGRAEPVVRAWQQGNDGALAITTSPVASAMQDLPGLLRQHQGARVAANTHADEVAFWLYTSGSTGQPKGARHVHSSPLATAELYGKGILSIREDDVIHSAAKLFFAYGLGNGMSFPLYVGATTILWPDRPTPEAILSLMRSHQPTVFCGVPTLYSAMLGSGQLPPQLGSARLRRCISAGEALPPEIGRRWRGAVGLEILDGIGSTEMLHIFLSNRIDDVRLGSTGKPVEGYQVRLIDERGHDVPRGEIGELVVAGPSAAEGYWNKRERSRRTFVGEWTHTGDKYRLDEDGYYHYCGRTDDMFKVSGIWVSPFEVESALLAHPSVLEAAVVGREDSDGLTKPAAFVVLRPGAAAGEPLFDQLKDHVKQTAGPWKYPRWISVLSELPKTATGKIQRFKLREAPVS